MPRMFNVALAGLAILAVSVTACSDDSNNDDASTATSTTTAIATTTATETATEIATAEGGTEPVAGTTSAGGVLAAIVLIDDAGFHGMDEALNGDAPAIEAAWVGATTRALAAAQAIAWPEEIQPAADAFITAATDLEAALEADDIEAAAPAAVAAHETQHDLSHDAYEHLGQMTASDGSAGAMLAALSLIDGAGFHGMDEALNGDSPAIESAWLGATNRARIAAEAVAWPGDLQAAADAFIAAAGDLEAALDADDAAAGAEPAAAAHETQHTLSHDAYHALGEMTASDDTAAGALAAIALIDSAGFHGMDDALNGDAPEIDAGWLGATQHARTAAQAIAWPGDVQAAADAFIEAAQALEAALEADDVAAAGPAATAAHDTQHTLSHDAYAALGGGGGAH